MNEENALQKAKQEVADNLDRKIKELEQTEQQVIATIVNNHPDVQAIRTARNILIAQRDELLK